MLLLRLDITSTVNCWADGTYYKSSHWDQSHFEPLGLDVFQLQHRWPIVGLGWNENILRKVLRNLFDKICDPFACASIHYILEYLCFTISGHGLGHTAHSLLATFNKYTTTHFFHSSYPRFIFLTSSPCYSYSWKQLHIRRTPWPALAGYAAWTSLPV